MISLGDSSPGCNSGVAAHLFECLDEARGHLVELAGVVTGEMVEHVAAFAGYAEDGAALVVCIDGAGQQAFALGAVDELDGAVVLQAEAGGGVGDGDGRALRSACNLQQELMLLRLKAGGEGRAFTEVEEAAQLMAEVGECAEEA